MGRLVLDEQPTVISSEPPVAAPHKSEASQQACHGGLLPGDHLEHFELLEFVGGGGMGRVFRARDTRLNRVVALKVLAPAQTGDADALARFQNEAQSAARLDHENIARVYHVGEDRGLHYIVFEYIEGVNLRVLVHENGPLPLADAVNYTLQVAEGLAHAASRDVVHRDIKPSNVLVTPSGRTKLIDMGLARLHKIDPVAADLTATGVTLGTFDYISPEQARDPRNADVRSDIYSLGCTFFFMLAGRPPFPEGTVLQKLLQHQGDDPPDVRQFRPEMPDALVAVLRRMLAKDPRNRYPAASELLDDLTALARQLGLRPLTPSGQTWEMPQPPRISPLTYHLPWLAPTAALLVVVAALHVLGGNDPPTPPLLGGPEEFFGEELPDPAEFAPVDPVEGGPGILPGVAETSDVEVPSPPADTPIVANPKPEAEAVEPATAPEEPVDEVKPPGTEPPSPAPVEAPDMQLAFGRLAAESSAGRLALGQGAGAVSLPADSAEAGRLAFEPPPLPPNDWSAASQQAGVLVVHDGGEGEQGYSSLTAALAVAETGNVIELRYNGPREQAPIRLANRRLTIRGGEGFEPVMVFRPDGNDPIEQPRSMISVASGELTLVNLALAFEVAREIPAEQWSLFEVLGGARLNVQRSTFSVSNATDDHRAYHPDVAFFRTRTASGTGRITADDAKPSPPVTIELADCAVRGQAALLRTEVDQAVEFDWENGVLATSEPAFSVAAARTPADDGAIVVNLRHITAWVGGGLLAMTDRQSATRPLPTQIVLSDSILAGVPGVPLVDQYAEEAESAYRRIRFQGNRNFYEGIDLFWRLRGPDDAQSPILFDFEGWQAHWGSEDENLPSVDRVQWQQAPTPPLAVHRVHVADFALADAAGNPARGAASNGRDAGCEPFRLPEFPEL